MFHRYVSREGSFESTVYTIRRDGTHRRRLARGLFPAWSARGEIAFVHQVSATAPFTDGIYAMRPDGGGLRRLTRDARDSAPNWSPHGMHVVFARAGGIARMRADGSRDERLVRRGMEPAWSPDGRSIVFSRGDALWTMRPTGADVRRSPPQPPTRSCTRPIGSRGPSDGPRPRRCQRTKGRRRPVRAAAAGRARMRIASIARHASATIRSGRTIGTYRLRPSLSSM